MICKQPKIEPGEEHCELPFSSQELSKVVEIGLFLVKHRKAVLKQIILKWYSANTNTANGVISEAVTTYRHTVHNGQRPVSPSIVVRSTCSLPFQLANAITYVRTRSVAVVYHTPWLSWRMYTIEWCARTS